MDETRYGLRVELPVPFDAAVARATEALQTQGFGVLTTIDVQQTLKKKLDRDFRPYVILGACNPPLAFSAVTADPAVGLLLPCNVTVEAADESRTVVRLTDDPATSANESLGCAASDYTRAGVVAGGNQLAVAERGTCARAAKPIGGATSTRARVAAT